MSSGIFTAEMLVAYLEAIGCTGLGRGEYTRFNVPWESFAIALATREGFNVDGVLSRVSVAAVDGSTVLSDEALSSLVNVKYGGVQQEAQTFRAMFCGDLASESPQQ